jgi:general secretion pathway protein M
MRAFGQALRKYQALNAREQKMVAWGGIAVAVVLFLFALVLPLYSGANAAEERVMRKADDLNWMRSVAGEVRAAGPVGPAAASGQSLLVIVDQTARQAGLGSSLSNIQPSGGATGGVRARLENAPFDTIVAWIAALQRQHSVTVESATIDRAGKPGLVNASVILRKGG